MLDEARAMAREAGREDEMLAEVVAARARAKARTAWRVEGTLREFPRFDPVDLWFDHPTHRVDESGVLGDIAADGSDQANREKGIEEARRKRRGEQREKVRLMKKAIDACGSDGVAPTRAAVLERIGEFKGKEVSKTQLINWTTSKAEWSPIRVAEGGKAEGLLEDVEQREMLADW